MDTKDEFEYLYALENTDYFFNMIMIPNLAQLNPN